MRALNMKFLTKTVFVFCFFLTMKVYAASMIQGGPEQISGTIYMTSYPDYVPFGYKIIGEKVHDVFGSVFRDVFSELLPKESNFAVSYNYFDTVSEAVIDMKTGKTQAFMGAFYASASFDDFDFVFPALLNNPVHIMMLPERIGEIKKAEDLKNLKGAYVKSEMFSNYMLSVFEDLGLEGVESTDEAYKKLLLRETDYVLGSYYYHYIKVIENGLKGYIAFSSKPLWNMPMFLAFSKRVENRKSILEYFRKLILTETFKEKLLSRIKEIVEEKEAEFAGSVPPMYILQRGENDLTPADEIVTGEQK